MAKRKRLSPAQNMFLEDGPGAEAMPVLETKAAISAPIAQVANAAATEASLRELSDMVTEARRDGRLAQKLPLAAIDEAYLVRDRVAVDEGEMEVLKTSLRNRGQQTPIEVIATDDPNRFGLISGWRRLKALRALFDETGDAAFETVLVVERQPDTAADAYLSMVEENEIRSGLSHYERARVAAKAVQMGVFETEKKALLSLFGSVSRSKRSKIRSFLTIFKALDDVLLFPAALGERLGLALSKALETDPGLAKRLSQDLQDAEVSDAAAEGQVLQAALKKKPQTKPLQSQKAAPQEIGKDLFVARHDGHIVLSGPGVTDAFLDDFLTWCKTRSN